MLFLSTTSSNNNDYTSHFWIETLLTYITLIFVIIISLILIALIKRYFKKEASFKQFRYRCDKALSYAIRIKEKNNKKDLLIASTKLSKLTSLVNNCTWIMSRLVEEKKDVVLNDIYMDIDNLSIYIGSYSKEGFYSKDDYTNNIDYVINCINDISHRLDTYLKDMKK